MATQYKKSRKPHYIWLFESLRIVLFLYFSQYYSCISKKLKKYKKTLAKLTEMVYNVIKVVESGGKRMKGGRK